MNNPIFLTEIFNQSKPVCRLYFVKINYFCHWKDYLNIYNFNYLMYFCISK